MTAGTLADERSPPGCPVGQGSERAPVIGRTARGTPIRFETLAPHPRRPYVLAVAGQHGDEAAAIESLREAVGRDRPEIDGLGIGFGWIAVANPDGLTNGSRTNGDGVDLNRDHIALDSEETRAIHRIVRTVRPDVVIDLHNYPSRRRAALRRGWVLDDDVLVATATHPGVRTRLTPDEVEGFLPEISGELAREGYAAGEYRLFQPSGRLRASSFTSPDLRNSIALRYDTFTVLLEGRAPRSEDALSERARLRAAQRRALLAVLRWAARHRGSLDAPDMGSPRPGERVPIAGRWARSHRSSWATVRDRVSGERRQVPIRDLYDRVETLRSVALPEAYAVRQSDLELIGWLTRQRFQMIPGTDWTGSGSGAQLRECLVLPVAQPGGRALAAWLEPGSVFRHPSLPPWPISADGPAPSRVWSVPARAPGTGG